MSRQDRVPAADPRPEAVRNFVCATQPVLLKRFEEEVADLRAALNGKTIRQCAAATLASLIESVTIYPGEAGPEAEVAPPMALGCKRERPADW